MQNIVVNPDGAIVAQGSGQTTVIAQLALATFNNPQGLVKLGSNRYGEYTAAGIPTSASPEPAGAAR